MQYIPIVIKIFYSLFMLPDETKRSNKICFKTSEFMAVIRILSWALIFIIRHKSVNAPLTKVQVSELNKNEAITMK